MKIIEKISSCNPRFIVIFVKKITERKIKPRRKKNSKREKSFKNTIEEKNQSKWRI